MTPEAWWKALEKSGWLDEVPKTEAARIKKAYRDCAKQGVPFRALAPDGFDAECIENPGDYKRWVVKAYVGASLGAFRPLAVRDEVDVEAGTASLSLKVGGKIFEREFEQLSDYVADGVHEFLNDVLEAVGIERRFYLLPSRGTDAGIVFVTPRTYDRARKLGIIPSQKELDGRK